MADIEHRDEKNTIEVIQSDDAKKEWDRLKQLRKDLKPVGDPADMTLLQLKRLVWIIAKQLKIIEQP